MNRLLSPFREEVRMEDAGVDDTDCGCCRPERKTVEDVRRELEDRRERLDRRLRALEGELVGAR